MTIVRACFDKNTVWVQYNASAVTSQCCFDKNASWCTRSACDLAFLFAKKRFVVSTTTDSSAKLDSLENN